MCLLLKNSKVSVTRRYNEINVIQINVMAFIYKTYFENFLFVFKVGCFVKYTGPSLKFLKCALLS